MGRRLSVFRSIYLKSLRDYRVPILGWGLGLGALMATVLVAIPTVFATPAAKAAVVSLGASYAWIAEPIKIDTAGGYATWKYGITILVVVIWPLLAGTGMLRGEEERGSLDVLLSAPRGRVRVALEKLAALWTALLIFGLIVGLLTYAGGLGLNGEVTLGATLGFGINLALIGAVFGSVGLFVSQFTQERRTASGLTAALLLVAIVVDMVHRVVANTVWLSQVSPIYYYNLSKPLVPGYGVNLGAMAFLAALTAIFAGAGVWLFARRDVGGVAVKLPSRAGASTRTLPTSDWSLRSLYARSLGMITSSTLWWTLIIALLGAWLVVIVKQTETQLRSLLQSSKAFAQIIKLGGSDAATNETILGALFLFLPILLMAFAVTQANRWSADEEDGLLEIVLSTPKPRARVLLVRFAALATATIFISVVTLIAAAVAAAAYGVTLDYGNLAAASLSMIPLGLLVAALGYLFAGWLRAAFETGLLSFLLVIWFFISFIGPSLKLPDVVQKLSPFFYYGTPLLNGVQLGSLLVVVAVGAAALALASLRFARKDIGA
jgi:polyether ionophore transport system permease protein